MSTETLTSADALAALRALGITDVASAAPVTGGADTAIFRVGAAARHFALRLFRPGQEDDCAWEVEVMRLARDGGIPVPEIHSTGMWRDRPALLMAWCPGRPALHHLLRRPWLAPAYGRAFGRVQAAIHAVPMDAGFLQRSRSWLGKIGAHERVLRERLREPDVRRDALLHLDYHPLNVMMERGRVTGVLDWSNAAAGDPRIDASRTLTILRLDRGKPGRRLDPIAPLARAFEWGWWHGYHETVLPEDNMALFYAGAGAIMERDLSKRYTTEQLAHVRRWTERWKSEAGVGD